MYRLKMFAVVTLVVLLFVSCQTNQNRKQAMELTEKGWGIIHHAGQYLQPGDNVAFSAIECFEQALALDSSNVMAMAGLAYRHSPNYYLEMPDKKDINFAKKMAQKALAIDPDLSVGYLALGRIYYDFDNDLNAAKDAFEKAIELDPRNADAYIRYSNLIRYSFGDFDEALEHAKKAVEIDPSHTPAKNSLAAAYRYLGRYDEGLEWAEKAFDDFKHMSYFIERAANLYFKGEYDKAIKVCNEGLEIYPNNASLKNWISSCYFEKGDLDMALYWVKESKSQWRQAWLYWEMGKKEQAQQILEELKKQSEDGQQVPWGIAWINMGLDDFENAIAAFDKSLEESIDNGWFGNFKYFIHAIDDLKVLHSYPRFQALLEKVNSTKI